MGFPRHGGHSGLRRVVRARRRSYDLERPTDTRSRFGDQTTSTKTVHDVRLWVQPPRSIVQNTEFGDRETADAVAIGLDGTDVQAHDRLVDGATEYEVQSVDSIPNEGNTRLVRVNLMKRVND